MPFNSPKELAQSHLNSGKEVILFDGVCHLCNSTIRFIANNDKKGKFLFLHLQTDLAKEIVQERGLDSAHLTSVVLLSENNTKLQSTAVLTICKQLKWPIPIFYVLMVVPSFIRNALYRFIAKNRYLWFGKNETCMIPNEKVKEKLLMDQHNS